MTTRLPAAAGRHGEFLTSQAEAIIACDFLHVGLANLRRIYALVFLEHGTRRLHIAGITTHPTAQWTAQQARNLTLEVGVRLESLRFVIRDRDSKYTESLDAVFEAEGMETVRTRPAGPRMNAHCERVIRTLRRELLDHVLIWNETHARHLLDVYARHYNGLCRSKSHRCMSCRVSVLVDEAAEDPGAQDFAGAEAMRRLFVDVGW
ncbi:integrase core domain-containing protein [Streptomyces sparsogenes]|uniref:integrase core domain-containing protein n=1 Tax=Streptomyces sparsogenes TaxID=67365 RepID=UPI003F4D6D8D